ncbi:MAG: NUDIX domain-containing protein [Comamonas sp.]|jgi:8-oxo-dGTP pyrophosphatase MutT (NUDIX family)|uniref:NUDIX hydrolase n=1 Tax=Comamonas sp. TaxID=34028 RepID=UPI00282E2A4A|nr:NUDIX domain-containing protein [Comamonas sp.]MDR0216328.1 NUDIX domain-containing protein [Comamonas sp.]
MNQQTRQWLQEQRAQAHQPPLRGRQDLCVDGELVGSIEPVLVEQLGQPLLDAHAVHLQQRDGQWHLQGEGSATQRLNQLALALRGAGLAGAWRDEQLAVCNGAGQRIATIERGAVRPLGIATSAVHLVGAVADGRLWVQQRSQSKANNPGMWDTLMGGMVSAEDSLEQALARETWEEAGLQVASLQGLRYGGCVEFSRPSDEAEGQGLMRERIDWFAAQLPESLLPVNQDGEVQRFELLPPQTVEAWLVQGRFTHEASLILAAYMGW